MKLSKSILSPVRATRDFSFLSRRLRSNGSRKGGGLASPFGKKRSSALETHEPSSPKVTCIGQVRVKSKRKAKAKANANAKLCRSLSRRGDLGEASFRKTDQYRRHDRNQRWVHLPISICEALRGFGAELCCLFHCSSRCCCVSSSEKRGGCCVNNGRGCGSVFCRWLLCVSDGGGGGRRREIEVVVGGAATAEERSSRRHVFEDIEVRNGRIEVNGEEEPARMSICIPPKNALLLMRCRSDPMKMAALTNRISWAATKCENGTDGIEEEESFGQENEERCQEAKGKNLGDEMDPAFPEIVDLTNEQGMIQHEATTEPYLEIEDGNHCQGELELVTVEAIEKETAVVQRQDDEAEEIESNMSSFEALLDQENTEHYQDSPVQVHQEFQDSSICRSNEETPESLYQLPPLLPCKQETEEELVALESDKGAILVTNQTTAQRQTHQQQQDNVPKDSNQESQAIKNQEPKKENEGPVLPDCLLLMMCEPKLSMEVSKETWVRGTDFIRWLPRKAAAKPAKTGCCHHEPAPVKRRPNNNEYSSKPTKPNIPAPPPPSKKNDHQPPRSSCSLPAAASSMANMLEQKMAGGTYEPLGLTRCKSEPMRTAAAKLTPESIFWKNSTLKMEPHRVGVGAAGIS